jgi:protein ImuA
MEMARKTNAFAALRQRIRQMERLGGAEDRTQDRKAVPFLAPVDRLWPEQGLPLGCLHEAASDGGLAGTAALTAFAGALAGRLGAVLWCGKRTDAHGAGFYAPGLAQVGLKPAQVLTVAAPGDTAILAAMEEGLRHPILACVVGEVERLDLTASRRLQLAAEKSGVTALVLRVPSRRRRLETGPIAAAGRWRITVLPSAPHAIPEAGRARWRLELLSSHNGATGEWIVEAPDAQGYLRLSSSVGDGFAKAPAAPGKRLAAG